MRPANGRTSDPALADETRLVFELRDEGAIAVHRPRPAFFRSLENSPIAVTERIHDVVLVDGSAVLVGPPGPDHGVVFLVDQKDGGAFELNDDARELDGVPQDL